MVATLLVTVVATPAYFPRIVDLVAPNRDPIDVDVQSLPPTLPASIPVAPESSASASASGLPASGRPGRRSNGPVPQPRTASAGVATRRSGGSAPATSPATPRARMREDGDFQWVLPAASSSDALQRTADGLDRRDRPGAFSRWVYAAGGADYGPTRRLIVLQGIDRPVVVTGMHADVVARTPALTGCLVTPNFDFTRASTEQAQFDLDDARPSASAFFANAVVTLGVDESVSIVLVATTTRDTVSWDLVVDVVVGGHTVQIRKRADDERLRTTVELADTAYQSRADVQF